MVGWLNCCVSDWTDSAQRVAFLLLMSLPCLLWFYLRNKRAGLLSKLFDLMTRHQLGVCASPLREKSAALVTCPCANSFLGLYCGVLRPLIPSVFHFVWRLPICFSPFTPSSMPLLLLSWPLFPSFLLPLLLLPDSLTLRV